MPPTTVPPTTVPPTTVPPTTVPPTTVPVTVPPVPTTLPEVTVPDVTVPDVTVPEVTVPEVTVPDALPTGRDRSPRSSSPAPTGGGSEESTTTTSSTSTTTAPPAPADPPQGLTPVDEAPAPGDDGPTGFAAVLERIVEVAVVAAKESSFPGSLLVVIALFLIVQDRIDRKDPKLALAPAHREAALGFDDDGGER
jgi:hypothetical protein